ncbi:hypothetical protein JSO59_002490 [Riemerella anatipestifer]|uniref:hypothetical protein n=1 Tax=Riemerella anatipestifer TaxID=34085 RepID=UPI0030C64EF0
MSSVLRKLHYYLFVRESKWNMLFILIPFALLMIWGYFRDKELNVKEGRYTIGYVYKIYWPVVSHKTIMYKYSVKGMECKGTNVYMDSKKAYEQGRYLVQFSLIDNKASNIFQDIPIPDSIKSAPAEGWKELPEWAKEKMKKYDR